MQSFDRNRKVSKSQASPAQRVAQPTKGIVDNRPQAVLQRRLQQMVNSSPRVIQAKGLGRKLPAQLKDNLEAISGYSLDDVTVHYNSGKPAEVGAHAYAQGSDIYLAPGQEKHLAHEAWHVVQQKQGRVRPTVQLENGIAVNDNIGLEQEADRIGLRSTSPVSLPIQRYTDNHIDAFGQRLPLGQPVLSKHSVNLFNNTQNHVNGRQPLQLERILKYNDEVNFVFSDELLQSLEGEREQVEKKLLKFEDALLSNKPKLDKLINQGSFQYKTGGINFFCRRHEDKSIYIDKATDEGRDTGTKDTFESPEDFYARTGKQYVYRTIRSQGGSKKVFGSDENVTVHPDGILSGCSGLGYDSLTTWPLGHNIVAVKPDADVQPWVHISGSDYATQYIATGSERGAAQNTVKNWNQSGPVGERSFRREKAWSPVIKIDITKLGRNAKIYDTSHPDYDWFRGVDTSGMMGNNSFADEEVLISGTIPSSAVEEIVTNKKDILSMSGFTPEEYERKNGVKVSWLAKEKQDVQEAQEEQESEREREARRLRKRDKEQLNNPTHKKVIINVGKATAVNKRLLSFDPDDE